MTERRQKCEVFCDRLQILDRFLDENRDVGPTRRATMYAREFNLLGARSNKQMLANVHILNVQQENETN